MPKKTLPKKPPFDPDLLDELARIYARAAVDQMIKEAETEQRAAHAINKKSSGPDNK